MSRRKFFREFKQVKVQQVFENVTYEPLTAEDEEADIGTECEQGVFPYRYRSGETVRTAVDGVNSGGCGRADILAHESGWRRSGGPIVLPRSCQQSSPNTPSAPGREPPSRCPAFAEGAAYPKSESPWADARVFTSSICKLLKRMAGERGFVPPTLWSRAENVF